ncbi:sporulation protein [Lysobacter sp. TY2-98]|uniref:SPOR domain-containing protein n=1 Tax=Lysobacter sp. TY2-98 TaxID=2290922 RepID=UPI000E209E04|nr:SPOR domain-containing protein [Lysobacter sp. TY2-98]AXK72492.1 sporulation protein [Lysobacter sp. TY2-98]
MEPALKQRLLGAAVLVALAVVFLPLLVMDPAPDSGASRVPLKVPPAPEASAGDTRTLDLPLAPEPTGKPVLSAPVEASTTAAATSAPAPAVPTTPTTAAGNYAVNFGSYATPSDAGRVIAALAAAHLPAYQEPAPLGVRTVHRVRIGPFATSADAEAARLAAGRVRSDVNAKVVVLDADASTPAKPAASTTAAPTAPAVAVAPLPSTPTGPVATVPKPAASTTTTVTAGTQRPATAASAPAKPATPPAPPAPTTASAAPAASNVGFAVQLGAFADANEATHLRDRARAAGFAAFVEQVHTDRGDLSRVRVGPVPDRAAADTLRTQVAAKLGVNGIVRPHP